MSATIKIELAEPHLILPHESGGQLPYFDSDDLSSTSASMSQETFLSEPVSQPRTSIISSSSSSSPTLASLPPVIGTTPLSGRVVLTLTKSSSIHVSSLAISLTGSSHLSLASSDHGVVHGNNDSRANTKQSAGTSLRFSRQHLRAQQFLIAPFPDPARSTLVSPSIVVGSGHFNTDNVNIANLGQLPRAPTLTSRSMSQSRTTMSSELGSNQVAFPFVIQVPNHVPVSALTPQGAIAYRLTAVLTIAKKQTLSNSGVTDPHAGEGTPSESNVKGKGKGLMATLFASSSALGASPSIVSENCTVHIFRAPFLRSPYFPNLQGTRARRTQGQSPQGLAVHRIGAEGAEGAATVLGSSPDSGQTGVNIATAMSFQATNSAEVSQEDESYQYGTMVPGMITHHWPECSLTATISLPYVHLPNKSNLDINVRLEFLSTTTNSALTVKNLQHSLYERVVYRVSKRSPCQVPVPETDRADQENQEMIVVGIRDRVISVQQCLYGWPTSTDSTSSRLLEKTLRFQVPNAVRSSQELFSTRNCNPSTVYRISHSERQQLMDQLSQLENASSSISGAAAQDTFRTIDIEIQHYLRSTLFINRVNTRGQKTVLERVLGDIPVVVMGLVYGPMECDGTGLPSYLGSFATSLPSLAETHIYEYETAFSVAAATSIRSARSSISDLGYEISNGEGATLGTVVSFGPMMDRDDGLEGNTRDNDAPWSILGMRGLSRARLPRYEESILSNSTRPSLDANLPVVSLLDR